jgi:cation diffusion facilitator family transporter
MHSHSIDPWRHQHAFLGAAHDRHERRTWFVVLLTAAMMIAEIVGGTVFGSMALVADGWHMSTHAAALAIAAFAYRYARTHVHDPRFSFGTGKMGELAGFASAIVLALVALFIGYESIARILAPVPISFNQAIAIAVVGLGVNLFSAWLLREDHHDHDHQDHDHDHQDDPGRHDHNLRAAYVHVLADAMTSVLAIVALLTARFYGWLWIDPVVGMVGAGVIAIWSLGLIRSAGAVLLDMVPNPKLSSLVRERLEVQGDKVSDLHLWRVGPGHTALIATVVADRPQAVAAYKARLEGLPGLSHVTVEIHPCTGHGHGRLPAAA